MCIPIIFGCQDRLKAEGDSSSRMCPNCHNASVLPAKATSWFELFWLPLVPFSSKHIWLCQICHWKAPHAEGQFEPAVVGPGHHQQGHQQQGQATYQPTYMNQPPTYMNQPPTSPPHSYQGAPQK